MSSQNDANDISALKYQTFELFITIKEAIKFNYIKVQKIKLTFWSDNVVICAEKELLNHYEKNYFLENNMVCILSE